MSPGAATVRAISRLPAPQVWRVRIDHSCAYFEKHLRTLDTIERERAARFRHVEDRRRFVLGRSSLRRLLAAELGVADSALVFGVNAFGKRLLLSPDNAIDFSSSHSGDWVLHAFDTAHAVGVDVECVRPGFAATPDFAVALSPEERLRLEQVPERDRAHAFARVWVRKEAYVKALGEGMSRSPAHISIDLDATGERCLSYDRNVPRAPAGWCFQDIDVDAKHVACLVTRSPAGTSQRSRVALIRDFRLK
jgi:4'-phosphopantetheinyl transferase